ncbi:MAG TPA: S9 family peptidase [Haliscomenobacter sp.]|uniref:S9 family peptidase n=1 Tax=Haliscomenobacter sp. TaxID=2717303 RepID=UPI002BC24487|nr:S9 family peptidase [Haliscomenobacter sp.]HOY19161.1 S9 family peptidase [Haliscomenobacter sp.]
MNKFTLLISAAYQRVGIILVLLALGSINVSAQGGGNQWTKDGNAYWTNEKSEIVQYTLPEQTRSVIADAAMLTPAGKTQALRVRSFQLSKDNRKALIYTNSVRVWRMDTRGDYWVLDLDKKTLKQLGANLPVSSLMFAKFSPDGSKVAYVSKHNLYVENLADNKTTQLTKDGTDKIINGTFDWAYEEEFFCRDGFRWSPDGNNIAYWQIDATAVKYFLMMNTTDSIYSYTIPVEYPKVGETPSACRVGIVPVKGGATRWMNVPGDNRQHYIPRMSWAANATEIVLQQLDRKQQVSKIFLCNITNGTAKVILEEKDEAWVDVQLDPNQDWDWINGGKEFLWLTEKDGWRHYYRISRDGKQEKLITGGNYDVIDPGLIDEKNNVVYFIASPDNAAEKYLYKTNLDGSGKAERLSPANTQGTYGYQFAPSGRFAQQRFSNVNTRPQSEWVSIPDCKPLKPKAEAVKTESVGPKVEFFQVTTPDNVTMDGWVVKPTNFDPQKKYPVVFYVYTEPAGQTVNNSWGTGNANMYQGSMADDGYVYVSLDNRGTPAPKGRAWRKSIYRKIGLVNIHDQAMGAKEIFKWGYIDTSRVAVWGWSGGGSATLNLLFQHPEIYKVGFSVAAVANQLCYDNIYQERYMGLPQENMEDFVKGSPITYAKNLKGKLLYVHGTGDDNVHYQNAELLINELIKHNKQFQMMAYPNRSHGISEGEGTSKHLGTMFTKFLRENCPPGGK